jgi:hypothetical protein
MHHADHTQHDPVLISRFAADELTSTDQARATALIDSCRECRTLRDDLLAIALATRALPAQRAPRDFRITSEQAAHLARTGRFPRLGGVLVAMGAFGRPIAATFTTLGLVGIFVAGALPGLFGAASMPAPEAVPGVGGSAATAASTAPGAIDGPSVTSTARDDVGYRVDGAAQASGAPDEVRAGSITDPSSTESRDLARPSDEQASGLLLWGSVTLLGVGLALFALRLAGRRLR